jgi:hypothetical protein
MRKNLMLGELFTALVIFAIGAEVGNRYGGAKTLWKKAKDAFKA